MDLCTFYCKPHNSTSAGYTALLKFSRWFCKLGNILKGPYPSRRHERDQISIPQTGPVEQCRVSIPSQLATDHQSLSSVSQIPLVAPQPHAFPSTLNKNESNPTRQAAQDIDATMFGVWIIVGYLSIGDAITKFPPLLRLPASIAAAIFLLQMYNLCQCLGRAVSNSCRQADAKRQDASMEKLSGQ